MLISFIVHAAYFALCYFLGAVCGKIWAKYFAGDWIGFVCFGLLIIFIAIGGSQFIDPVIAFLQTK